METDISQSQDLSLLHALTRRPEIKDTWFNGKTVTLDGFNFVGCRFDNCELRVGSEHFEMHNCFVDDKTSVYWSGPILKVIRLFNRNNTWYQSNHPTFAPVKNSDGTITITTGPLE